MHRESTIHLLSELYSLFFVVGVGSCWELLGRAQEGHGSTPPAADRGAEHGESPQSWRTFFATRCVPSKHRRDLQADMFFKLYLEGGEEALAGALLLRQLRLSR